MASRRPAPFAATLLAAARLDLRFFRTSPKFAAAIAVFLVIPALYAAIYLASLWDPASLTRNLEVVLVDEDEGTLYRGTPVDLGKELVEALERDAQFTYRTMSDAQAARTAVDAGTAAFAVLIPRDFSRLAMDADRVGAARFVVHASQGNDYAGAAFARRFAPEVSERLNQALNERRFASILRQTSGSADGLQQLRQALVELNAGAAEVADGGRRAKAAGAELAGGAARLEQGNVRLVQGLRSLDESTRRFVEGVGQASGAVRTMTSRLPPEEQLRRLRSGAGELAAGQRELAAGLASMEPGAARLRDGARELGEQLGWVPFLGDSIADGADALQGGAERLRAGLATSAQAGQRLERGAGELAEGVGALTQGMAVLSGSLFRLDATLPPRPALDGFAAAHVTALDGAIELSGGTTRLRAGGETLARGLDQLEQGSVRMRDGLALLQSNLPSVPNTPEGTPAGLSESIRAQLSFSAPVPNQGSGTTPNLVPLALWVGATLCAVLFAFRVTPEPLAAGPVPAIVLGKLVVPSVVVVVQSAALALALDGWLHVHVVDPLRFLATLAATSLTFLAVLFMLVRVFGAVGKLMAVILLVTQLAASGATVPIALSTPFFQALHPWLPMSWSVRAIRIAMFDAYGGAWGAAMTPLLAMSAVAVVIAMAAGRGQVVPAERYQPLVD